MLGAVIFRAVEGLHEEQVQQFLFLMRFLKIQLDVTTARHDAVDVMWNATFRVNKLDEQQWKTTVYNEVIFAFC